MYYLRAQKQAEEFEALWSKSPDIAYCHNGDAYIGPENVKAYYVAFSHAKNERRLQKYKKTYPKMVFKNTDLGMGNLTARLLTTPYIVVAGDGKTAKGLWFSPDVTVEADGDGTLVARGSLAKFGVDFIYEDGAWKLWHVASYGEFGFGVDEKIVDGYKYIARPDGRGIPEPGPEPQKKLPRTPFSATSPCDFFPPLPVPYESWDNSLSFVQ